MRLQNLPQPVQSAAGAIEPHDEETLETDHPSPVIGWAGRDRPQRARAIAGHYLKMKESEGWSAERLLPLLVALAELIPWLKQWHNALDRAADRADFGERLGDYFDGFLAEELRALELSRSRLVEWQPPAGRRTRRAARG